MKYTGRILSLLIAVIYSAGFIVYHDMTQVNWGMDLAVVCSIILGWRLGKQYDKVKYCSEIDELTGSYNRRFAMELFPKLKLLSYKKRGSLVILLIDVNDFKLINDQHDHMMGDAVLQGISSTLQGMFRKRDYVCRWGGDEFVIIVSDSDESQVSQLQERIHGGLQQISGDITLPLSVSVGYAVYPREGTQLMTLVQLADHKMYADKQHKKDGEKSFL